MRLVYRLIFLLLDVLVFLPAESQDKRPTDSLGGHKIVKDRSGKILPWYKPDTPGAAYTYVAKVASEFIKSGTPVDPTTGLPMYLVTCCFAGPHMTPKGAFEKGKTGEDWMHNPAMVYAGMVHSLVMGYRVYSGDESYVQVVKTMLDYQLSHGTTPEGWQWAKVPYASSNPFEIEYYGATKWENDGMRGDGLHGVEPDKIGELGLAYLLFYEVTLNETYLKAAFDCADALAKNVREPVLPRGGISQTVIKRSPWPFRVNARNGIVVDEYCSNVVEPVRLLDELIRISERISAGPEQTKSWQRARDVAWKWLYSRSGPMKSYVWNAYFEDVPSDPDNANRNQVTPLETARYLLRHPEYDPEIDKNVPALIHWVEAVFGSEDMDAINEQHWCYEPMGSHTARFASICAMWFDRTGQPEFKEKAYRYFNNATYSADANGVVRVGPFWSSSWFSDGYSDYIRHFLDGIAAIPEWAPAGEDHVLSSSSAVQRIGYLESAIEVKTFDTSGKLSVRMKAKPKSVTVTGKKLAEKQGWTWKAMDEGGLLIVNYAGGAEITISKK